MEGEQRNFGRFRLDLAHRRLLYDKKPVRLGNRARYPVCAGFGGRSARLKGRTDSAGLARGSGRGEQSPRAYFGQGARRGRRRTDLPGKPFRGAATGSSVCRTRRSKERRLARLRWRSKPRCTATQERSQRTFRDLRRCPVTNYAFAARVNLRSQFWRFLIGVVIPSRSILATASPRMS